MPDALNVIGQALTLAAKWLDHLSGPLPWPLIIGLLFLPFVAALRFSIWFMRGRVWPVPCKYYRTLQPRRDKPCRQMVAGEWKYCRHHKRHKRMSNGHQCDPTLQRWQGKNRAGQVIGRKDVRGVGFVSLLSDRETLLFYKGVARRPRDVFPEALKLRRRLASGWQAMVAGLRSSLFLKGAQDKDATPQQHIPAGVAARMPRVVKATRSASIAFFTALVFIGISVLLHKHDTWRAITQYTATGAFVIAWNSLRFGIWKDPKVEPRWIRNLAKDSLKGMTLLIVVALAGAWVNAASKEAERQEKPRPTISPTAPATPNQTRTN